MFLSDLNHWWSNDVQVSVQGDLDLADLSTRTKQRILRRLMTSPGEYIFQPGYGAGLPSYVGQTLTADRYRSILGLITSQIALEDAVAKDPQPVINLSQNQDLSLFCNIQYTDAITTESTVLAFTVSGE